MTLPTNTDDAPRIDVRDLLNAQAGKIGWDELQRHFARGVVIVVGADLDLLEVAARFVDDDSGQIQRWLDNGAVSRAQTDHARDWQAREAQFWAVVAAPWVLVQEINNG